MYSKSAAFASRRVSGPGSVNHLVFSDRRSSPSGRCPSGFSRFRGYFSLDGSGARSDRDPDAGGLHQGAQRPCCNHRRRIHGRDRPDVSNRTTLLPSGSHPYMVRATMANAVMRAFGHREPVVLAGQPRSEAVRRRAGSLAQPASRRYPVSDPRCALREDAPRRIVRGTAVLPAIALAPTSLAGCWAFRSLRSYGRLSIRKLLTNQRYNPPAHRSHDIEFPGKITG